MSVLRPSAPVLALWLFAAALAGQAATRLYVEPLQGSDQSAARLHDEFLQEIRKHKDFVLVARPEDAEKLVSITGETHIRGYLGRNIRLRYVNADSQPVYGGYLSIEPADRWTISRSGRGWRRRAVLGPRISTAISANR